MTISFDLTGIILLFSGLGLIPGLFLGLVGKRWLFIAILAAAIATLTWFYHIGADETGRRSIGHAIILVGGVWSVLVTTLTYNLVRLSRKHQPSLAEDQAR